MNSLYMTFGKAVKAHREQRGWTQNRLATQAGVQQPTLQRIESNPDKDVWLSIAAKLAGALGVTVDSLLAEAGEVSSEVKDDSGVLSLESYREIKANVDALQETAQRTRRNTDRLRLVEEDVHRLTGILRMIVHALGERVEQRLAEQTSHPTPSQRGGKSKRAL